MIWINFFKSSLCKALAIIERLTPRQTAILCFLLLCSSFFVPLWSIAIYAPQYPEGLYLSIWINKISGDVQSVNTLNHYVGMRKIDANSIPELVYMPMVLAGICGLVGIVAVIGKRWALGIWYAIFAGAGSLGLWDFYRWEYEYGHNISPDAPIKIPGMVYQPPFFGTKDMLNITATSLPDIGGWILLAVGIIGALPLLSYLLRKKISFPDSSRIKAGVFVLFALILSNSGCLSDDKPEPIILGADHCHSCKMTITDARFGGEVILKTGKIYKFDAIHCLLDFTNGNKEVEKIFINDFFPPGHFVKAEDAYFMVYPAVHGPMGATVLATSQSDKLIDLAKPGKADILRWPQILSTKDASEPQQKFGK
jgi:copper chaperone NosL